MSEKIQLGKTQELIVVKTTDFGVYLNTPGGEDTDKILLPKAQVPKGTQLKDALTVFVLTAIRRTARLRPHGSRSWTWRQLPA